MTQPRARCFRFGDFELDRACFELRRAGVPRALQSTPFRLLDYLIERRDRVVSKGELLEAVWPRTTVSDAALSSALKEIRRALGDDGVRQCWIRTLRGRGYRFVGELRPRRPDLARATTARSVDEHVLFVLRNTGFG